MPNCRKELIKAALFICRFLISDGRTDKLLNSYFTADISLTWAPLPHTLHHYKYAVALSSTMLFFIDLVYGSAPLYYLYLIMIYTGAQECSVQG